MTPTERVKRSTALHQARRKAFYESRGGVCGRCGGDPYTALWEDPSGKLVGLQKVLGWAQDRREAALPDMELLCYQCYLDRVHGGRPHGSLSRYGARGCRCAQCLKGRADYEHSRRMKRNGISKRKRWKYDEFLLPTKGTAPLWYTQEPSERPVTGWWTTLARDTVDKAPKVDPEPKHGPAPKETDVHPAGGE